MKGLWILRGSNPPLYTRKAADVIKHKETGKEYIRGEMKLFKELLPQTVEETGEYEFIYLSKLKMPTLTDNEQLNEIRVSTLLKGR